MIADLTPERAISAMWRLCDKPERFRVLDLIDRELGLDEKAFWGEFWKVWVSHESIHLDHRTVVDMMARHDRAAASHHLSENERAALAELPDPVEVYRGCRSHNVKGWSWSLDPDKARFFATRSSGRGRPLLLHAIVPRAKVLALLTARDEQEIVVDPDDVLIHYREKLAKLSPDVERNNAFFQMMHSRIIALPGEYDMLSQMMIRDLDTCEALHTLREQLDEDRDLSHEFGIGKRGYFDAVFRAIDDKAAQIEPASGSAGRNRVAKQQGVCISPS